MKVYFVSGDPKVQPKGYENQDVIITITATEPATITQQIAAGIELHSYATEILTTNPGFQPFLYAVLAERERNYQARLLGDSPVTITIHNAANSNVGDGHVIDIDSNSNGTGSHGTEGPAAPASRREVAAAFNTTDTVDPRRHQIPRDTSRIADLIGKGSLYGTDGSGAASATAIPLDECFSTIAQIFPKGIERKEIILILFSFCLAVPSVVPNWIFGGSFGKNFAELLNDTELFRKKLKIDLSEADIEKVRTYGAIMSAIVNGCINTRSIKNAISEIETKCKNIKVSETQVKLVFSLLAMLAAAGIAAIPNLEFVRDTLQSWTHAKELTMEIITGVISTALNLRSISGVVETGCFGMFGKKNRAAAKHIRHQLLTQLNNNLPNDQQLPADKLTLLSEGTLYKDKFHPHVRTTVKAVGGLEPVVYAGAYFLSAKEAMDDFENVNADSVEDIYWRLAKVSAAYTIATLAGTMKLAFLSRANMRVVDRVFDHFFATEIIKLHQKTCGNYVGMAVFEVVCLITAGSSLTGAAGLTLEYIFNKDSREIKEYGFSLLIAALGGGGINYIDFKDITANTSAAVWRIVTSACKDTKRKNTDRFGDNPTSFYKAAMLNIAKMSDSEILRRYTDTKPAADIESQVEENAGGKLHPLEIAGRMTNDNFDTFMTALQDLGQQSVSLEKAFENFLNTHEAPPVKMVTPVSVQEPDEVTPLVQYRGFA